MPWTNPITWTIGQILTAAQMNEQLRGNMLETTPAKVSLAGDTVYASGPNSLTRLGIGTEGQVARVAPGNTFQYAGSMTKLAETILAADTPQPISIAIPSASYRHLQLEVVARSGDTPIATVAASVRVNSDAGTNYGYVLNTSTNTATSSTGLGSTTSINVGQGPAVNAPPNHMAYYSIMLPDYTRATFKYLLITSFATWGTADTNVEHRSVGGVWRSTAPVTSIQFILGNGNVIAGSTFTLYGRN